LTYGNIDLLSWCGFEIATHSLRSGQALGYAAKGGSKRLLAMTEILLNGTNVPFLYLFALSALPAANFQPPSQPRSQDYNRGLCIAAQWCG